MQATKPPKKILLVEDEPHLAYNIEFNLLAESYSVEVAPDGLIALEKYHNKGPFDLIILDVMIPELNGFEVAKRIRQTDKHTGILILTARAEDDDKVRGLELGADDYITKPFLLKELLLRVRRMAERSGFFSPASTENRREELQRKLGISFNPETLELLSPSGKHQLTALEAKVLMEFLKNENKILSREYLLSNVWGLNGNVETRTVDNFILRLRKNLEDDPSKPKVLISVRGRGYILKGDPRNESKI